ncbi:HTH-type transcriptional regulator EbgR [Niallia circulans]|jgi:LacI family transcriptional regulator|uniref:LacI family DNA-binding transcriptional regulator n=1 Tax=Niallia TaxID=2837506 RepID=UPI00077C72D3|nr:LacI family DNA-binding transcriptional regulator [Niallia circulans]MDR4315186.1 LacI family DNA-binding transcriptional regulator [Niallia circulans]MED3839922.1 LacI family DNA-binding transcriptional regulator [Niallia circulans]MED4241408.1 LacI family DNA-binding transcriptional regulator [Niallia circulans]MED4248069.1 LacI family DNA-binding transcriptional regulator [Niallia circulans]MED5103446.1 LacI family DNA-binding transcriptional regulator [Niallia circulans]
MATIKEIADKSNVSASTVSRVLNNDRTLTVQAETRERIIRVAKELGYETILERRLKQRKSTFKRVGIILTQSLDEEISDPYFLSIRQGIEMELASNRINTVTFRLHETESNQMIEELDGLIVVGRVKETALKAISQVENIVYINHSPNEDLYDSVGINFERATEKALKHLVNIGYKRIGYIGGKEREHLKNQKLIIEDKRLTTFERFMKEQNLFEEDSVFIGEYTMAQGYELMQKAIQTSELPEAFFIGSDPMAIGALRALQEVNLNVPSDVAIISFDDIEAAKFASTPLTTIRVHTMEMGRTGVRLLLDRLKGRELPITITLPTELVIRESCGGKKNYPL